MKQLRNELKSSPSPRLQAREGGADRMEEARQQRNAAALPRRGRYDKPWRTNMKKKSGASAEEGVNKPQPSSEPHYSSERPRHYSLEEVQISKGICSWRNQ